MALSGIKILDLTRFQNGPSATERLATDGADVIKVEPPNGDVIRGVSKLQTGLEEDYNFM